MGEYTHTQGQPAKHWFDKMKSGAPFDAPPSAQLGSDSVFCDLRIDVGRPGINAARKIVQFFESALSQKLRGLLAATTALAVDNDLAAAVEFIDACRQVAQRNEFRSEVGDLVFVRLAHVEHEEVFAGVESALEFDRADLRDTVLNLCRRCLRHNAAELVIVDKLSHCRILSAHRAFWILPQL